MSKKISFELGIGIPSIGFGVKVFPYNIKERKAMFHIGFSAVYCSSGDGEFTAAQGSIIYISIGFELLWEKRLQFWC